MTDTAVAKRSVLVDMSIRYGMEPAPFEQTLRATVFPANGSREDFAAFLIVAKDLDLDPIKREIFAYPKKGGGIQAIVSVDGWMRIINRQPQMDGMTFVDHFDDQKQLTAITCRIYRKDRTHPVEVTEYMSECYVKGSAVWEKWRSRMLRHKSAIQCGRYAFGISGIQEPDEYERGESVAAPIVIPPRPQRADFDPFASPAAGNGALREAQIEEVMEAIKPEPQTFDVTDFDGVVTSAVALGTYSHLGKLLEHAAKDPKLIAGIWESNAVTVGQLRDAGHKDLADALHNTFQILTQPKQEKEVTVTWGGKVAGIETTASAKVPEEMAKKLVTGALPEPTSPLKAPKQSHVWGPWYVKRVNTMPPDEIQAFRASHKLEEEWLRGHRRQDTDALDAILVARINDPEAKKRIELMHSEGA